MKRGAGSLLGRVLYWLVLLLTLAFLVVPAVLVVVLSFSNEPTISFPPRSWGLRNYETLAASPAWGHAAALSLGLATVVAALSAVIAVPAVFAMERTRLARLPVLSFLAILPLLVPQAAYAIGVYMVMVQIGMLGSVSGLAAAHAAICFPYLFVIVRAQMKRMSPELDLVAMTLGASRRRAWLGISLRLLAPTILSGALFAFLISFDEAVFANFLAGPGLITLPKSIFDSVRLGVDPVITAIATLLMAFTAIVLLAAAGLRRRRLAA
jgi:putative spermidine/putrescine transport system permease protein